MADPNQITIPRERISLRQLVVARLRDLILDGTLPPGQKLGERDLCERLGVSRTLLRESLQQLQAEGLIVTVLHRGPSVAIITEQDAREIYEVRKLLEPQAARQFAVNATDSQIEQLRQAVDRLRLPEVNNDAEAQLRGKNDFYEILLAGCGNATISQLLTLLNNRITMLRRLSLAHPGRLEQTLRELDEIVEAAGARDAELIFQLSEAHVARAAHIAMDTFATPGEPEEIAV